MTTLYLDLLGVLKIREDRDTHRRECTIEQKPLHESRNDLQNTKSILKI